MSASDSFSRAYLIKLRDNLVKHCTDTDLQIFCFDLDVDYETVVASKSAKPLAVMALINYLNSRGRLAELVERASKEFSNVDWEDTSITGRSRLDVTQESNAIPKTDTEQTQPAQPSTSSKSDASQASIGSNLLVIESSIRLELTRVSAGEFLMGSDPRKDKDAQAAEMPQHKVYMSEFYIGRYTVTNAQYEVYAREKQIKFDAPPGKENHPVVNVSWHDALAFCEWLSAETHHPFRLPTEAEWEKAARGTGGRIYPWGDQFDPNRANVNVGSSRARFTSATTPVGNYSPIGDSPYGAADMAGNVWEWCADSCDENEYKRRVLLGARIKDPTGSATSALRASRGGALDFGPEYARCAFREWNRPDLRGNCVGFRVVMSPISL